MPWMEGFLLMLAGWQVVAARDTDRLLFKHSLPQLARSPDFYAELQQELIGLLRGRLLQESELRSLHLSALDSLTGIDVLETPAGSLGSFFLSALQQHPGVEFAEEDVRLSAFNAKEPNDPNITEQWAMFELGLFSTGDVQSSSVGQAAWDRSTGSSSVIVCVIDSGIDYDHPDLKGNVWINAHEIPDNGIDDDRNGYVDDYFGYNFLNMSGDVMDANFHGTHLAGIVGAVCNNHVGVCGVSPSVKAMACKFLDSNGNGYTSDAIRCMSYALQMGAQITLNSYGAYGASSQSLLAALERAESAGQLYVTAAGNDYGVDIDNVPVYPASYQNRNIISVIATDQNHRLAAYSNYGQRSTDIAAPGSNILSTVLAGQYGYHEGTSQSAGYVAGAAALLLAAYQTAGFNITGMAVTIKANLLDSVLQLASLANTSVSGGELAIGAAMALVQTAPQIPQDSPALPPSRVKLATGKATGSHLSGISDNVTTVLSAGNVASLPTSEVATDP